jgi:hypothetical protein
MSVELILKFSFQQIGIFLNYSLLSFTIFFDLEEIISENFNISENNIISVELAKVLGSRGFFFFPNSSSRRTGEDPQH